MKRIIVTEKDLELLRKGISVDVDMKDGSEVRLERETSEEFVKRADGFLDPFRQEYCKRQSCEKCFLKNTEYKMGTATVVDPCPILFFKERQLSKLRENHS